MYVCVYICVCRSRLYVLIYLLQMGMRVCISCDIGCIRMYKYLCVPVVMCVCVVMCICVCVCGYVYMCVSASHTPTYTVVASVYPVAWETGS
jgi:hypothetical protein